MKIIKEHITACAFEYQSTQVYNILFVVHFFFVLCSERTQRKFVICWPHEVYEDLWLSGSVKSASHHQAIDNLTYLNYRFRCRMLIITTIITLSRSTSSSFLNSLLSTGLFFSKLCSLCTVIIHYTRKIFVLRAERESSAHLSIDQRMSQQRICMHFGLLPNIRAYFVLLLIRLRLLGFEYLNVHSSQFMRIS